MYDTPLLCLFEQFVEFEIGIVRGSKIPNRTCQLQILKCLIFFRLRLSWCTQIVLFFIFWKLTHKTVFFIRIFNNLFDNNDYLFRLLHYIRLFLQTKQWWFKNSVKSLLYVKKGYFFNCKWHLKWITIIVQKGSFKMWIIMITIVILW